jgi:hypothetical protein
MDNEKSPTTNDIPTTNPIWVSAVIVLLWLVGFGVFLLFGFFTVITIQSAQSGVGTWNLLVTLAEGVVLFIAARHFFSDTQSMSTLFFWVAIAAVGIPLIAAGGCSFLPNHFRLG